MLVNPYRKNASLYDHFFPGAIWEHMGTQISDKLVSNNYNKLTKHYFDKNAMRHSCQSEYNTNNWHLYPDEPELRGATKQNH